MPRKVDHLDSQFNTVPPTRYVVHDKPMADSTLGEEGGITMVYTGTTREHPWASRKGERVIDGNGTAKCSNGDEYEGDCKLGMFHGNGKMIYANGDIYEGTWKVGLRDGYGVLDTADGRSYTGLWLDGEKDGLSEETGPGYQFVGIFRNGWPNGLGRIKLNNGDVYDAIYVDGRLHGRCTIQYEHGDTFVGTFVHGLVHGEGKYTQKDTGDEYSEEFFRGKCVKGVLDEGTSVVRGEGNFREPLSGTELARYNASIKDKAQRDAFEASLRPNDGSNLTGGAAAGDLKDTNTDDELHEEEEEPCPPCRCIMTLKYQETGDIYEGEWKRLADGTNRRGVRHGYGKMIYHATGDVYEGDFKDDLREGFGTLTFAPPSEFRPEAQKEADSLSEDVSPSKEEEQCLSSIFPVRYEGDFHNDLCDGRATVTMSDQTMVEGFWTRGERNGLSHSHPALEKVRFTGEVLSEMFSQGKEVELDYHRRSRNDGGVGK